MSLPRLCRSRSSSSEAGWPAVWAPGSSWAAARRPRCGIAGTYGLKKEKYEIAQAVGKPLFDMVKENNDGLAACDTETCRWQIENSSGVETVHPIVLVHKAYGLS